jgi:hypothetical protein
MPSRHAQPDLGMPSPDSRACPAPTHGHAQPCLRLTGMPSPAQPAAQPDFAQPRLTGMPSPTYGHAQPDLGMPSPDSRACPARAQPGHAQPGHVAMITCGSGATSNFEQVNTNTLVIRTPGETPQITLSADDGALTFHQPQGAVVLDAQTLAALLSALPPDSP